MKPKFRVWDKSNHVLYDANDVYALLLYENLVTISDWDSALYDLSINKVELMQYTGSKDKNGVEVYLNDIVEDEYGHRYEVVFEGDCLRCNGLRINAGGHRPKNRWFGKDLGIIGNRYENPELLEVEHDTQNRRYI